MSERYNLGTDVSQASLPQLVGEITRDMSRLVRQEMDLAKAELRQQATTTGKAAGMFGGAGLAGYMVLLFLSLALWWGLSEALDHGWVAALIVAAVWAVIGAMLFLVARGRVRQMRQAGGMRQTTETVREVPGALKGSRS